MSVSCAEILLEKLAQAGVSQVFGIPGNHTVPLYRGFADAGIRHLTCRHEQGAAFMADGYARVADAPGVCVLISGPGLLNAATAIAQARADSVPMLVITGVAAVRDLGMGRGTLHELPDQHATAASLCRASHTLLDPANLPELIDRAFAVFSSQRPGPVHIEIPLDLMAATLARPFTPQQHVYPPGPSAQAITDAAARLAVAEQPLMLLGGGAARAGVEATALAEALGVPVLNTVNGKGVCPAGHPLSVGGSPSLPSLSQALSDADCVLAVGTELAETDYDLLMAGGAPDTRQWIRIDIDAERLLIPSPPAVAVVSDARLALAALTTAVSQLGVTPRADGGARAQALREQVRGETHYHSEVQAFFDAIQTAAPGAVLVGDSTRPTYYAAWQWEAKHPRSYFHSVAGFGTLGYALPAAFGARLAASSPVIALIGDGGIQFTLPELTTGAEAKLGVPVIVWNNEGYAEIENSMTARGVAADSTRILTPDFAAAAEAHRCAYARPQDHAGLVEALKAALAAERPTLIEVRERDFLTTPSGGWYR